MRLLRRHYGKPVVALPLALALYGLWWAMPVQPLGGDRDHRMPDPPNERQEPPCLSASHGPVTSLAFSRDGKTLFAGYRDGNVVIWDLAQRSAMQTIKLQDNVTEEHGALYQTVVVASPTNDDLHAACRTQLNIFEKKDDQWKLKAFKSGRDLFGPYPFGIRSLAAAPNGNYLALGLVLRGGFAFGAGNAADLERPPTVLQVLQRHGDNFIELQLLDSIAEELGYITVHSVAFSPDGKFIAVGTEARQQAVGAVHLFELKTGLIKKTWLIAAWSAHNAAFSPDGRLLACAGKELNPQRSHWEGEIKKECAISLWDLQTLEPLEGLVGHKAPVLSFAFAPDGKHLVSSSEDKTLRIWNVKQKTAVATIEEPFARVLAISPDGKLLATSQEYSEISLRKYSDIVLREMSRLTLEPEHGR
jgi:WD40 repeat protein